MINKKKIHYANSRLLYRRQSWDNLDFFGSLEKVESFILNTKNIDLVTDWPILRFEEGDALIGKEICGHCPYLPEELQVKDGGAQDLLELEHRLTGPSLKSSLVQLSQQYHGELFQVRWDKKVLDAVSLHFFDKSHRL